MRWAVRKRTLLTQSRYYVSNQSGLVVRRREAFHADSRELLLEPRCGRTRLDIL